MFVGLLSCKKENELPIDEGEQFSGGVLGTVNDATINAFSLSMPGISSQQELDFFVGNSFFNQNWVMAPSSTSARDGLGPLFNARSCSGCHFKDGRGRAPENDMELTTGFIMRLNIGTDFFGRSLPDENYGTQIQNQGINGVNPEAQIHIQYEIIEGTFADGEKYLLRKPLYTFSGMAYGPMSAQVKTSPRVAPHMSGLGLLENISETDILKYADENDQNQDGISGRPNYVWDFFTQTSVLGRFGWKANQPSLQQQVISAFLGDIGITTSLFSTQNCTSVQMDCLSALDGGHPEIEDDDVNKVVLYCQTLAVPQRRDYQNQEVLLGKTIFNKIKCGGCHVPSFTTQSNTVITALSQQKIFPYTDLLLHDMGDGLADGRQDFLATGKEWRTPPLWGIGLFNIVNSHTNYLHDGRARNIEEAILWHDGEGKQAQLSYKSLSKSERTALLKFLNSL